MLEKCEARGLMTGAHYSNNKCIAKASFYALQNGVNTSTTATTPDA